MKFNFIKILQSKESDNLYTFVFTFSKNIDSFLNTMDKSFES